MVRFLVPSYVQDDPSLAGVHRRVDGRPGLPTSSAARTVRELLPREPPELPVVNADDTILEVAAMMARLRCPLVAVVNDDQIIGVITASRLLRAGARPH